MQVFTDAWVQELRRRYDSQPLYQRPFIYFLAVSENHEAMRDEIEGAVGALGLAAQESLLPRLRSIKNFRHTYNELAVGSALRSLGYELEYEKRMGTLTPDWYVSPTDRTPGFLVEVFTADVSVNRGAKLRSVGDLLARLEEIPADVVLSIRLDQAEVELNPATNKAIAQVVHQWLSDDNPAIGAAQHLYGIAFEVLRRSSTYSKLQLVGPAEGFMVNEEPLRRRLEEKVRKYKDIAVDGDVPLVVAVVAEFLTGLGFDDLQDVLLGQEAVQTTVNQAAGTIIEQRLIRQSDGLVRQAPVLSAAVFTEKINGEWTLTPVHNPNAANPLPIDAFGFK